MITLQKVTQMLLTKRCYWFTIQSRKESISLLDGADRTVGSQIVTIPTTYAGDTVELFMAFISADGSQVSNSIYLGSGTAN